MRQGGEPQGVQAVRQGEPTPYHCDFNPLYINPPTLPSLLNFISGYTTAARCHHIDEPDTLRPFHDFVAQQPGYAESTAGFANMILACVCGFSPADIDWPDFPSQPIAAQQHAQAVERFYRLLTACQPSH